MRQQTCIQYLACIMREGDSLLKPADLVSFLRLCMVWALSLGFIEKKSKGGKTEKARLQSFFSTLGLVMILLHGWSHFWKATTMNKSTREEMTTASGNAQEIRASLSKAKVSCLKIFPPVSGCLSASCLRLAFFAARERKVKGSFYSIFHGLTCHPKWDDHQDVGDELEQDQDGVLHEVHFLPPLQIGKVSSA